MSANLIGKEYPQEPGAMTCEGSLYCEKMKVTTCNPNVMERTRRQTMYVSLDFSLMSR